MGNAYEKILEKISWKRGFNTLFNDETFEKFQYILGKKPNVGLKIKDIGFDFSFSLK